MADVAIALRWSGDALQFDGGVAGGPQIRIDGSGNTGPSPLATLLLSLGGCMAADIVDIAVKSRAGLTAFDATVEGDRAEDMPRRYTRITMNFTAHGVAAADETKLQRALELSREKYCSVLHSLRPDIVFDFHLVLA